ncbi:MAG: hypothetical protein L0Z53_08255, partial [Acidobacteriales bacterium]|nr:hypothetical protein [Terriglobales bacterium]
LLIIIVAGLRGADASAATASLSPVADAFVSAANPSNNYGGAGAVHISAPGLAKGEFQSLFRFDVSSAAASFDASFGVGNWSLESASLQMTASLPNNPLFNASAAGTMAVTWMQNDSWMEGAGTPMAPGASGVTWASLPTFLSAADQSLGTIGFDGTTSGTKVYALTLASGFISDVNAGSLSSILLSTANGDTSVSGLFTSRSNVIEANRPVLTLTAVAIPEPSAGLLLFLALVSIAFMHVTRRCG